MDPEPQTTDPGSCAILEPPATESTPAPIPSHNPKYPNLRPPWQKGEKVPGRGRKTRISLKTLEAWIRGKLSQKDGKLMEALADAIIQGAIEREPACLNWLGDRLWKPDQTQEQGRVIVQGIRLELPGGATVEAVSKSLPSKDLEALPQQTVVAQEQ